MLGAIPGVVFYILDADGQVVTCNAACRDWVRQLWAAEIGPGGRLLDLVKDAATRKDRQSIFKRVLRGESMTRTEQYLGGEVTHCYEATYQPRTGHAGVIAVLVDVTQRQDMARQVGCLQQELERQIDERSAALESSERKYEGLFASSMDALLIVEQDNQAIVDANPAAGRLYGYGRAGLLGLAVATLSAEPEATRHLIETGRARVALRRHRKKDGSVFPVTLTSSVFQEGGKSFCALIIRDISEQQQAQAELADQRQNLELRVAERTAELTRIQLQQRALLDSIPDLAWLKDTASRFVAANEPFSRACGVPQAELTGKSDLDIWPRHLAEQYRGDDQLVMQSKRIKRVEERLKDKRGNWSWIDTIKVPILDAAGQVIGTAGIARDITERKKEAEFLQRSAEQKTLLLREIHHRVKNNLAIVLAMLQMEEGKPEASPQLAEVLRGIRLRIRTMSLIHEQLYRSFDIDRIAFAPYLRMLAANITGLMPPRHIQVQLRLAEATLSVDSAIPCGLIVNELLVNAFRHAFENCPAQTRCIELTFQPEPSVLENTPTAWRLTVRDNGVGLPADFGTHAGGALGMQIVRLLVSQLRGRLEFGNDNGAYVSVVFTPREPPTWADSAAAEPAPPGPGAGPERSHS